jgi:hypothetical protein
MGFGGEENFASSPSPHFSKCGFYHPKAAFRILEILSPYSQEANPLSFKPLLSGLVRLLTPHMDGAIHFDRQTKRWRVEVHDVRTHWMLPPELHSRDPATAQQVPQVSLATSIVDPQMPG